MHNALQFRLVQHSGFDIAHASEVDNCPILHQCLQGVDSG